MLRPAIEDRNQENILNRALSRRLDVPKATYAFLLYAILAFVTLAVQSVSMDELVELKIARKNWLEIIWEANSFPPLFHLLIAPLVRIWQSPLAIRLVSVVAGGIALWSSWRVADLLFGPRTALATAWFVALNPLHHFYAQQGRSYALFYALTILTWWLMVRAIHSRRYQDWGAVLAGGVLGCYTHYYFAIFLAVAFLSGLVMATDAKQGIRLTLCWTAIAFLAIPALFLLPGDFTFQVALRAPQQFGFATAAYTYLAMFTGTTLGPSQYELHFLSTADAIREVFPWGLGVLLALGLLVWSSFRAQSVSRAVVATLMMAFLPVLLIGIAGRLAGLTYNLRFSAWCLYPLAVFLCAGFTASQRIRRPAAVERRDHRRNTISAPQYGAFGLLVLLGMIAIWNRNTVDRYKNEDMARTGALIRSQSDPSVPVFVLTWYMTPVLEYYLPAPFRVVPLPDAEQATDFPQQALAMLRQAAATGDFWLVYSRAFHGDPQGEMLRALQEDGLLSAPQQFAGVEVYRSKVADKTP
jgi:Dolichyl-phosphate-mannose-protein mannosyltransferase